MLLSCDQGATRLSASWLNWPDEIRLAGRKATVLGPVSLAQWDVLWTKRTESHRDRAWPLEAALCCLFYLLMVKIIGMVPKSQ